jgi:hypothetical protein
MDWRERIPTEALCGQPACCRIGWLVWDPIPMCQRHYSNSLELIAALRVPARYAPLQMGDRCAAINRLRPTTKKS